MYVDNEENEFDAAAVTRSLWCPLEALEDSGEDCVCAKCQAQLGGDENDDGAFYDGEAAYLCHECALDLVNALQIEAEQFALDNCKITHKIEKYDPSLEFRCTPEEYANGQKQSYTPNAYATMCRHHHTNYDLLLAGKDRDTAKGKAYYRAIRNRILNILQEAWRKLENDEEEEMLAGLAEEV